MRRVDGDRLIALGLEGIHDKGPFEGHAAALAHLLDRLDFAVGQCAGVMQKAADQRRFAVIDMADDGDVEAARAAGAGRLGSVGENFEFSRRFVHGAATYNRRRASARRNLPLHGPSRGQRARPPS